MDKPKRALIRTCTGCGKVENVSNYSQLKRQCRSCSKQGNTSAQSASLAAREKMAAAKRGSTPWNKGKCNVYSEDVRKRMGQANVGRTQSEETQAKRAASLKEFYEDRPGPNSGKHLSEVQRRKISESLALCKEARVINSKTQFLEYCKTNELKPTNQETLPAFIDKQLKVAFECGCGETFTARMFELELGNKRRCRKCSNTTSGPEIEIYNWLTKELHIPEAEIKTQDRAPFMQGFELDLYLPNHRVAIEYHGLAHHSERPVFDEKDITKVKLHHRLKYLRCDVAGVRLIQIFEDEWLEKSGIVKSMIRSRLGLIERRVNARACEIKPIPTNEAKAFFSTCHISGYVDSKATFGLFLGEELVSAISLRQARSKDRVLEITRFASQLNTQVNGGFQKLLKHAEVWAKENHFLKILTYADLRFGTGAVYLKSGFSRKEDTVPNYFYEKGQKRVNRFQMKKSPNLPGATEREQRNIQGWYAIYDAGSAVYIKELK